MIRNLAGKKSFQNESRRHSKTEKCGVWSKKKNSLGGLHSMVEMAEEERLSEHERRSVEIIQLEKQRK